MGQSGCFSPKSNKQNVRNSFRGFFRRLSGNSKDTDVIFYVLWILMNYLFLILDTDRLLITILV